MKKTLVTLALILAAGTAQAEIAYDYKNAQHKADNTCVGVLSLVRDALFNGVQVKDDMAFAILRRHWLRTGLTNIKNR